MSSVSDFFKPFDYETFLKENRKYIDEWAFEEGLTIDELEDEVLFSMYSGYIEAWMDSAAEDFGTYKYTQ